MSGHTKGPWKRAGAVIHASGVVVGCFTGNYDMCGPEDNANKDLITAAPDLLEALERIARPHDCGCLPCIGSCTSEISLQITVDEMREIASTAIAKARGEK